MLGVAIVSAMTSANKRYFDPKYRLIRIAVTPAPSAISRTPTPSNPARTNARRAEARIALRVAAAFRRRALVVACIVVPKLSNYTTVDLVFSIEYTGEDIARQRHPRRSRGNRKMDLQLADKRALVIGSTSGIGAPPTV